jgi:hypothetical protein
MHFNFCPIIKTIDFYYSPHGRMLMNNKIIDFLAYKLEKSLKKDGYVVRRDNKKNINVLLKINREAAENNKG